MSQVEDVAQRLRINKLEAKTITLKLRYENFRTITRSNTFDDPTNITKILWQGAEQIFLKWYKKSAGALRLLGFGTSGLQEAGSGQHQLFPEPDQEKHKRLDEAFDKIRDKFGHDGKISVSTVLMTAIYAHADPRIWPKNADFFVIVFNVYCRDVLTNEKAGT